MTKAALYARVSTAEQSTGNQLPSLRRLAEERELVLIEEYVETASGAGRRPELDRAVADAKRRRFRVLLVWSLDRLGRNALEVLNLVEELQRAGVQLLSAKESWLDARDPHVRSLLMMILSWVADWERRRLRERTIEGMARAKSKGKAIGRPRRAPELAQVVHLHALNVGRGTGYGATARTARQLGISAGHVRRLLQEARKKGLGKRSPEPH